MACIYVHEDADTQDTTDKALTKITGWCCSCRVRRVLLCPRLHERSTLPLRPATSLIAVPDQIVALLAACNRLICREPDMFTWSRVGASELLGFDTVGIDRLRALAIPNGVRPGCPSCSPVARQRSRAEERFY